MSTVGVGVVALPLLGLPALVVGMGVGMGILAVQGVMWCGDRLQEHYEGACRQWTGLMDAAWAEHLTQVTDLPDRVAQAIERTRVPAANLVLARSAEATGASPADLLALLEEARAARMDPDAGPAPGAVDRADDARLGARRAIEAADRQLQALREQPDGADRWLARRQQVVGLQGVLAALDTMHREMRALALAADGPLAAAGERIASAASAAEQLLEPGAPDAGPARLAAEVRDLEAEVFGLARRGQRDRVAGAIAGTLRDLGYRAPDGGDPAVAHNGDYASVAGLRDGRAVTFDVALDGQVTYDLSGYVGDACRADAAELFEALRSHGVVILDGAALERLESQPEVTAETLVQLGGQPETAASKAQAEIAERLLEAMHRMGFRNIVQSAAGGTVDIEGFDGRHGYRVVLPPDGRPEIRRGRLDVTADAGDPVAAAAMAPQEGDEAAVGRQRERVSKSLDRSAKRRSEHRRRQAAIGR